MIISELSQTFINFVELGSLQATAEKRGLTQPAVSHHLKSFESQFKLKVFTFSGRRKILTQYGQQIYLTLKIKAEEMNLEIEKTNRMFFHPSEVTLRLGMRHEVARKLTPHFDFPGKLIIEATSGHHALEMLERREIDLVVTERMANRPDLHTKSVFTDRVQLIVSKSLVNKAGAIEKYRDKEFLLNNPFMAYRNPSPFLADFTKGTGVLSGQVHFSMICEDWNVVVNAVEHGKAWSLVPSGIEIDKTKVHVVDVPEKWGSETHFYAYYYAEFLSVPAFKDFLTKFLGSTKNIY